MRTDVYQKITDQIVVALSKKATAPALACSEAKVWARRISGGRWDIQQLRRAPARLRHA